MVFDHKVRYGDKLYAAGEDVPIDEPVDAEEKAEDTVEVKAESSASAEPEKPKRRGRPKRGL